MLDISFCDLLEIRIGLVLRNSLSHELRNFWCDVIILPALPNEYSQKAVNDKRQIELKAFVGSDGQDKYNLILQFGRKSLSRYSRGLDISDCIPNAEDRDWFEIDPVNKLITIYMK